VRGWEGKGWEGKLGGDGEEGGVVDARGCAMWRGLGVGLGN